MPSLCPHLTVPLIVLYLVCLLWRVLDSLGSVILLDVESVSPCSWLCMSSLDSNRVSWVTMRFDALGHGCAFVLAIVCATLWVRPEPTRTRVLQSLQLSRAANSRAGVPQGLSNHAGFPSNILPGHLENEFPRLIHEIDGELHEPAARFRSPVTGVLYKMFEQLEPRHLLLRSTCC